MGFFFLSLGESPLHVRKEEEEQDAEFIMRELRRRSGRRRLEANSYEER
jgi:hypothetical protein